MSDTLQRSDFLDAWAERLKASADSHPAVSFDGRVAFPAWLVESARDQAERVFLALDTTPIERRDIAEAERIMRDAGMAFLEAWMLTMEAFGTGAEPWARNAALAAGEAYRERFVEIAPALHQGGHSSITMTLDTYGHLFPRGDDGAELEAAERALLG